MAPSPTQSRKITVVGGSGNIGAPIVASLVESGIHKISVISRADSDSKFDSSIKVHRGSYEDDSFLESALAGQDVLIIALSFHAYGSQIPLIKAAAKARVPYIVPCEFGSDSTHGLLNQEIDLMNAKKPFRDLVEELGVSSWIGVTNNPWFDYCMKMSAFDIDLKKRTATLLDGGHVKANFSTLDRVGKSLAALLSLPEADLSKYKNDWVYFSSFLISQDDILESAIKATGTKREDWTISHDSAERARAWAKAEAAKGNQVAGLKGLFFLMFSEGFGGNYSSKVVDYEQLGLAPGEDLDEVVRKLANELAA